MLNKGGPCQQEKTIIIPVHPPQILSWQEKYFLPPKQLQFSRIFINIFAWVKKEVQMLDKKRDIGGNHRPIKESYMDRKPKFRFLCGSV
jgi:hypothetical protein